MKDSKDILQKAFADFEPETSRDLWGAIEANIGPVERKKAVLWPWAMAATILLLAAVAGWWLQAGESSMQGLDNQVIVAIDSAKSKEAVKPMELQKELVVEHEIEEEKVRIPVTENFSPKMPQAENKAPKEELAQIISPKKTTKPEAEIEMPQPETEADKRVAINVNYISNFENESKKIKINNNSIQQVKLLAITEIQKNIDIESPKTPLKNALAEGMQQLGIKPPFKYQKSNEGSAINKAKRPLFKKGLKIHVGPFTIASR